MTMQMFQNWIFSTWAFHLLFSQTLPCFHPQVSLGDLEEIMLDATMLIIVKGKERDGKGVKNSHILPTGQWYAPSAVIKHA